MRMHPYLALEASAGSGKTFALSVRYLSLLFLGAPPHKIVALTFTNKSAAEMKTRIFETLKALEHKEELNEIALQTGLSKEQLLKEKARVMHTLLQAEIKIATLDSFFGLVLRHFSLHAGLQSDFTVVYQRAITPLVERFIGACKRAKLYGALIAFSLNEEKRLGDIFKLMELLYHKKSQLNFEAFAHTHPPSLGACLEILAQIREHFEQSGLSKRGLATLEAKNSTELLGKKFLAKEDFGYWDYQKHANARVNALLEALKAQLRAYVNAKEGYTLGQLAQLFGRYDESVRALMKENGELGFEDVTQVLYGLLSHEIHRDFLYFRLDGAIEHLLIDEFQDTSIVQYRILQPLIEEIRSGQGVKDFKTLFFVGDVKQSIYRFRGGAKELFGYAKEALHLDSHALDTNYRSSAQVVTFVNEVFHGKIAGYEAQKVSKAEQGYVKVIKEERIEPEVLKTIGLWLEQGIKAHEIALLVHTNNDAKSFQESIQEAYPSLHVRLEATLKLIEVPIIRAIIAHLKYLYFGDPLYKATFLVLCGMSWDTPLFNKPVDLARPPLEIVESIIREYGLFDGSADVLSFLEVASRYEEIESFLFALETLGDEASSEDEEGLRVLTIHKSKGLEFEHVIVCDRLSRDNNRSDTLLFSYDGIEIDGIYLSMAGREAIDPAYQKAKEREATLLAEDRLNALYVAFTRAKRSLCVCAKEEGSAFASLELTPCERGKMSISKTEPAPIAPCMRVSVPRSYGSQQHAKASEEVQESHEIASMHFGIAQHYLLEMLDAFDRPSLERAFIALQNRFAPLLSPEALQRLFARGENLITHAPFLALLEGAKVFKEQPLIYQKERKQIDLLLEHEDKIIIIDYKSSPKYHDVHQAQVRLYQEALHAISGLRVEGYICYLHEKETQLVKSLYNT